VSIADIAAGMYAFSAILATLYARQISGVGASIEVTHLRCAWPNTPVSQHISLLVRFSAGVGDASAHSRHEYQRSATAFSRPAGTTDRRG
jgi:CoA-transferase family III